MKYFAKERISNFNIHYDLYSLDYFLDCTQKLGLKNVELLSGGKGLYFDYKGFSDPKPVRRKLEQRGLSCRVISPHNCDYQYQFAAKDEVLRERSYEFFANGMRFGAELGAKVMQANSGWGFWNEDQEEAMKRSAEMHQRLCELGDQLDVTIACETLRPQESKLAWNLEGLKKLFDMVDHRRFKVMVDITAMAVAGETVQQWFDTFGTENIIHTHFQDCDPYGHRVWGDGNQNLNDLLKAFKDNQYEGLFSQELTVRDYYADPYHHDKRNITVLDQYFY